MKQLLIAGARRLVMMAACAGVLAWTGCKKSEDAPAGAPGASQTAPDPIDMTQLKEAFASADPALRLYMEESVSLVRARSVADARDQFNKMLKHPKLTPEQRKAVQDALSKLDTLGTGKTR